MTNTSINWNYYCNMCKDNKIVNPYKNENEFNRAYGIQTEVEQPPLQIRPKNQRPVSATIENHTKIEYKDFRHTEEFFDYHEANKLLKQGF